jgi:hypothetical protein
MAKRPDLVALRQKITVDPQDWAHENTPRAEVVVDLKDKRTLMHGHNVAVVATDVEGQWERLTDKFRSIVSPILGATKADAAIELVTEIDGAKSVVPLLEATR